MSLKDRDWYWEAYDKAAGKKSGVQPLVFRMSSTFERRKTKAERRSWLWVVWLLFLVLAAIPLGFWWLMESGLVVI